MLYAGAVVPAAVEQHDLAGRREVWHIALEVPLRTLAVVRCRERHDAAYARIEPLGDALDGTTLAGSVTTFEQDDDLLARGHHPILQLHEFRLEPEQLPEVVSPIVLLRLSIGCRSHAWERMVILDLHLQFFIVTVRKVAADAEDELIVIDRWQHVHGQPQCVDPSRMCSRARPASTHRGRAACTDPDGSGSAPFGEWQRAWASMHSGR